MKFPKPRFSKTPPPGWPTEEEWVEIEKELATKKPTRIRTGKLSPTDETKKDLCVQFIKYCNKENITQKELAKRLKVTESRVSEILSYNYERFTIDKLLEILNRIKPEATLHVVFKRL